MTDITALEAAQREAQARTALLQLMLDNMRHGIALFGPDRRLVSANALAGSLLGLPAGRLLPGRHFDELVAEQIALGELNQHETDTLRRPDRSRPLHYTRTRRDGATIEVISDPTPDGGFVVTYSDITARRSAEHAAARRAVTLQAMLDHSRHGIALYDPDHRLVTANALFATLSRLAPEALVPGTRLGDLLRAQAAAGGFGADTMDSTRLAAAVEALDRSRAHRALRHLDDGRVVAVASDPIPGGGFVVTLTDITPLARAEAEARARATLLQTTLDHMNHSIVLYGPDRRLRLANRLAAPDHGLPVLAGRTGETIDTLIALQHEAGFFGTGEAAAAAAAAVVALDRSRPQRYQRVLPDGQIIAIASDPTPDGGFVVTNTDVTALHRAEAEAEKRASILALMLDNMRHGICLFDADGRVVAANELALQMTGLDADDLLPGASIAELGRAQLARGEFQANRAWRLNAARDGEAVRMDPYRRVRPDGAIIEVVTAATPDGGFVRSYTDVTPLAEAEAEARRRADLQEAMLANIRHGILLVDAGRRVVVANPVLLQMVRLHRLAVAPGQPFEGFIAALLADGQFGAGPEAVATADEIVRYDRRQPRRIDWARPDHSTIEVTSDPTPDGGFVLSFTDVTEQRRARADLERARDAAEAATRAKSRFLATMSHELRTPLNAVIGFSEAIRAAPDRTQNMEYLGAIQEAGRHLLGLIDDILDVARTETSGLQLQEAAADLGDIAAAALRVMGAAAATAGITLELDWPAGLPRVRGDSLRIRQVLLNLLSNAIKFTPSGGRVRVAAARDTERGLALTVTDNGIGIAAHDIARAFEPFVQVDNTLSRRFPGSGLGLYLSRALAVAHGAELTLDSAPGVGTTARLRFPRDRLLTPVTA